MPSQTGPTAAISDPFLVLGLCQEGKKRPDAEVEAVEKGIAGEENADEQEPDVAEHVPGGHQTSPFRHADLHIAGPAADRPEDDAQAGRADERIEGDEENEREEDVARRDDR